MIIPHYANYTMLHGTSAIGFEILKAEAISVRHQEIASAFSHAPALIFKPGLAMTSRILQSNTRCTFDRLLQRVRPRAYAFVRHLLVTFIA